MKFESEKGDKMASRNDGTSKEMSMNDLTTTLRSILVASLPEGLTIHDIQKDFSLFRHKPIPFRDFGFASVEALLSSLSDVIVKKRGSGGENRYFPVSDASTKHIEKLVTEQKSAAAKQKQQPLSNRQNGIKQKIVRMLTGKGLINYSGFIKLYSETYGEKFDSYWMFGTNASTLFAQRLTDIVQTKQDRNGQIFIELRQEEISATGAFAGTPINYQLPAYAALPPPPLFHPQNRMPPPWMRPPPPQFQMMPHPILWMQPIGGAGAQFPMPGQFQFAPTLPRFPPYPGPFQQHGWAGTGFTQGVGNFWNAGHTPVQAANADDGTSNVPSTSNGPFQADPEPQKRESPPKKSSQVKLEPVESEKETPSLEILEVQLQEILSDVYPGWMEVDEFPKIYKRLYGIDLVPEEYHTKSWRELLSQEIFDSFSVWTYSGLKGWMLKLSDQAAVNKGLKPQQPLPASKKETTTAKPQPQPQPMKTKQTNKKTLISDIRRTLATFPDGIPGPTLPNRFKEVVGRELNPETYGYHSLDDLLRNLSGTILRAPDGKLYDRQTEMQGDAGQKERERKVLTEIKEKLLAHPEGFVTLKEVRERFATHGLQKEQYEIMQILWVQNKDCFKAEKVAGEQDLVTKLERTEERKKEVFDKAKSLSPLRKLNWEQFPASRQELDSLPPDSEKRFVQVEVAHYNSLSEIWINLAENIPKVEQMMIEMRRFYGKDENAAKYKVPLNELREGMVCAVLYREFGWHRAVVEKISTDKTELRVFCVDYGTVDVVRSDSIKYLDERFFRLPAQAMMVSLPVDATELNESANKRIQERFFKVAAGGGPGKTVWIFAIRVLDDEGGRKTDFRARTPRTVETEFFLCTPEGNQYVTQGIDEEEATPQTEEEQLGKDVDLLDLEDWEEEEIEAELRAVDEPEFIPADPDLSHGSLRAAARLPLGMTPDSAKIRLQVLQIQRMRLTEELSRPNASTSKRNVELRVDELYWYDREIKNTEDLLSRLGIDTKVADFFNVCSNGAVVCGAGRRLVDMHKLDPRPA